MQFSPVDHAEERTKPSDSDDSYVLGSRSGTVLSERGVDGDSSAEHGSGHGGIKSLRNGDHKVTGCSVVIRIASVRLIAFSVTLHRKSDVE